MDGPAVECLREAMKSVNAMTLALALLTLPAPHDPAQQRSDECWAGWVTVEPGYLLPCRPAVRRVESYPLWNGCPCRAPARS